MQAPSFESSMKITPTVLTSALAGCLSAMSWPLLWPLFTDPGTSSSLWMVLGMLLLVALPAHAFVFGFGGSPTQQGRTVDVGLLKRIGAWLSAAILTAGAMTLFGAPTPLA